ncbi:MAG: hypothetical protein M3Q36_00070 [bacterium]|nr:hypothetical protein [bacterium]
MVNAIIAALVILGILVLSEIAWKKYKIRDELARKFVHISSGVFIAFLPFWVDYFWIMILAVGLIVGNILNRFSHVVPFLQFHAINGVKRKSAGDILLGVGVFAVAWFEPSAWLFAAAILQVSIADGFAALAGVTYGKKHGQYFLFGQPKSVIGSAVFLVSSMIILVSVIFANNYFVDPIGMLPVIVMLPLMLVCLENMAVYGFDNIVLPLATLGVLSLF